MIERVFPVKLIMTMPGRGKITLESSSKIVGDLFDDVKAEFCSQISAALAVNQITGEVEIVRTEGKPNVKDAS